MSGRDQPGRLRILNPLCVRFSQPRIARHFRDGHLLHETANEFSHGSLEDVAEEDRPSLAESAPGVPAYDTVLVPPFPPIRVISWRPKLRRPDGEAERDAHGATLLGGRAWFALDNRRLYSMQQQAAQLWPKRCCVVVECVEEVPGTTMRELRKFRTTTEGKSVQLGARTGDMQEWAWTQDAPEPLPRNHVVEAEGLCAEDLYDAKSWASAAVEAAERATVKCEEELLLRQSGGAAANADAPVAAPQPRAAQQPPAAAQQPQSAMTGRRCVLSACPAAGWEYVDPKGQTQGPFGLDKMRLWHQHGFFYPGLPMRCSTSDMFVPFAELWPPGMTAFSLQIIRYTAVRA